MTGKGVLLLGGGGFIGTALARRLEQEQVPVYIVGRNNIDQLSVLLARCDTVVHLASSTTPGSSATQPQLELANLQLTQELVDALQSWPDKHLIFFSSGGALYGNPPGLPVSEYAPLAPLSPHGLAKVNQELICNTLRAQSRSVSILRPSNAYGPRQNLKGGFGLVRTLLEHARNGTPLQIWGNGENVRDYLYIDDLVDAVLRLIAQPVYAGTYNVGSGVGYSVNQVRTMVEQITDRSIATIYHPERNVDVLAVVLDVQKIVVRLGWTSRISLAEGIERTWWSLRP